MEMGKAWRKITVLAVSYTPSMALMQEASLTTGELQVKNKTSSLVFCQRPSQWPVTIAE